MRPVISPEFDLRVFCYYMMDKDPAAVMEAASAEISYVRHNHREQTTESRFRKGSRGEKYCEALQSLIRLLMNGKMPGDPEPQFIEAITPLLTTLLGNGRTAI